MLIDDALSMPTATQLARSDPRAGRPRPAGPASGEGRHVPAETSGAGRDRPGTRSTAPAGSPARHRAGRVVDLAGVLSGLGLGAVIGLAITAESSRELAAPGGLAMAIGRLSGLIAAYLMLLMVLLMARIPALERAAGQDRLARWHRRIGGWPIALIAVHGFTITLGYGQASHSGLAHEAVILLANYPDILAAAVGGALLVMAGVASFRAARRHLAYETWWAIHLYIYLALALAFAHQIVTGASFLGHPLTRALWTLVWAATAGTVLAFRVGLPLWRSVRHRLYVVAVRDEAPGVVSIVCGGRKLEHLDVTGGQFFQWRFLARGLWWQAHPYSLSALPAPPYLRLTVRTDGDHGAALAALPPGTRVAIEGPYGAFTPERAAGDRVLLVGAGVGVTPLRTILEALPPHVDAVVIVRASSREDLVLHDELTRLVEARNGAIHEVLGSRHAVHLDRRSLRTLVPDVADRDLYVCGPEGFADKLVATARRVGVAPERIHRETFAF